MLLWQVLRVPRQPQPHIKNNKTGSSHTNEGSIFIMRTVIAIVFLHIFLVSNAQVFYRVECDVSIKEINGMGEQQLMVGKVYFDRNIRQVIYKIRFPQRYNFAVTDHGVLTDSSKVDMTHKFSTHLVDFSIFNLVLNGKLNYYGLDQTSYNLVNTTREDDMVISEWELPVEMQTDMGKMLISQKNKQMYGMVSLNASGDVISKQFFKKYTSVGDLSFPTELIQINYIAGEPTVKKITTFRNIKLNSHENANYSFN